MALLTSLIGAGGGGGGSSTLSGLTDTNISSPLDTETLTYDTPSGKWINATASASVATLNAVGNVTIVANSSGEILKWNGSAWVNNTLAEAGVAAASHTHATSDIDSGTFADARIAESNVTQHEAAIDHDALTNFVANEHIDWTGASANFSTTGTGAFGGDITDYEAVNDGNPEIRLGAADAEELHIQTVYNTGAQTLDYVLFQTDVASAAADKGLYRFNVDGTDILDIDDGGLELTGSITVSGTVDGRDIATDGTKLDGVEALADVTDYTNVEAALSGGTITSATVATGDKVLIQDINDSDNLKQVTAQSIADLAPQGTLSNVVEDTTPQLGGALDVNGNQITSVSAGDIELHSDNDVNVILGDALGVDDFNIKDSADVIVFGVDSDGAVTATGDVDISGQSLISTGATDIGIHSDNDVNITLGDSAGLDDLNLKDSGNTLIWSVNSNGQQTMTSNIVMADNSVTGVDTITFTDTAGTIAGIQNQNLVDKTATEVITGDWDFGGAGSLEIPNSATPTVNANGEIAIDTTVTDFSAGVLKYYSTEEMAVVAMPIAELTSPTDGHVVSYNATNDEFELAAAAGGGGGDAKAVLDGISKTDLAAAGVNIIPGGYELVNSRAWSSQLALGDILYFPMYVPETRTYNDISFSVTTAGTAGNVVELIIYNVGSNNLPGTKRIETGSIAVDSTGVKSVAIDVEIPQGMYYFALLLDNGNVADGNAAFFNANDGGMTRQWMNNTSGQTESTAVVEFGTYTVGNAVDNPTGLVFDQEEVLAVWLEID